MLFLAAASRCITGFSLSKRNEGNVESSPESIRSKKKTLSAPRLSDGESILSTREGDAVAGILYNLLLGGDTWSREKRGKKGGGC